MGGGGSRHSPSVCWDGVRRETRHQFIYDLYASVWAKLDSARHLYTLAEGLTRAKIVLVDDLG